MGNPILNVDQANEVRDMRREMEIQECFAILESIAYGLEHDDKMLMIAVSIRSVMNRLVKLIPNP